MGSQPVSAPASAADDSQLLKPVTEEKSLETLLQDQPIYVNSIASGLLGLDQGSILRELHAARHGMIRFYMSEEGGGMPLEEAIRFANVEKDEESLKANLRRVVTSSVDNVSWYALEHLYQQEPQLVKRIWKLLKEEAHKELSSGNRMATALETQEWEREPWQRAQFLAIREGFVEEWQPRGAIESSLIDMMAQTYSEYLHWCAEVHKRSTAEAKVLYNTEEERRSKAAQGYWLPPRVTEQQAIEHAMQMLDRFNRLFMRTLRQLRDLRRYAPTVTINNPQQVNIAADGGQQVNLAKGESPKS